MNSVQDTKLGTQAIGRLMVNMAIPAIAAQLINVLYNIVDRVYIGRIPDIGSVALTGVGVTFPIITLISAFSAFAGAGGAPLAAIYMGRKDIETAQQILGNCICMLLSFAVILTAGFMLLKVPLLYLFGASDQTLPYANAYITIYLIGTIFVQLSLGLNMFISAQGFARTAMLSILIGAIINIVLDPIFIFAFHMGVRGAALATIISQAVSCLWIVSFLRSKKSMLRIQGSYIRPSRKLIGKISSLGISPFIMYATESAVTIVLNNGLQRYGGDLYVGSMTILQSVLQFIVVPINGFTQGVQPIISYNYGAGLFDRVKHTIKLLIGSSTLIAFAAALSAVLFPGFFASLFTSDPQLIALVTKYMPIFMFGMMIFGVQMGCQASFLGLGQAKISLFIALLRKVILLIPLAIILPRFFGVIGIYYAEPISDITSALTAGTLFVISIKKILSTDTLNKII